MTIAAKKWEVVDPSGAPCLTVDSEREASQLIAGRPGWRYRAEKRDLLVSMSIEVTRDGSVNSDVQTHDNSYADVLAGLEAVKQEIERVFAQRRKCPHYPANRAAAKRKVIRSKEPKP